MRGRVLKSWPQMLVIAGLLLLAWPSAIGLWSSWQARQGISRFEVTYDAMEDDAARALIEEARAYNDELISGNSLDGRMPYGKQLALGDEEMIAHISIPCLSLDLPVFHGVDEATLMAGVGHLEGSALPVGTPGGRCVLAAHSGMPNACMFDEIDALEAGDRFVLRTLGCSFVYEVVESEVVLPEQTDALLPMSGRDLVTLVTCTPRGANTHRLLVTGERREERVREEVVPKTAIFVNSRTTPLLVGVAAVGVTVAVGTLRHARRRGCMHGDDRDA